MLLPQKKHSAFLGVRTAIGSVLFVFSIILAYPVSAHAGFFSNLLNFFGFSQEGVVEERASRFVVETQASAIGIPALDSVPNPSAGIKSGAESIGITMVQDSGVVASHNPIGTIVDDYTNGQIVIYTVKPGDTPFAIAKAFDITVNTLLWANDISNARAIKPGDKLIILPISGVQVEVEKGNTIDAIAKKYKGNIEDILIFNGLSLDEPLAVGTTIIIPDGEMSWIPSDQPAGGAVRSFSRLPSYDGYYLRPIQGGTKTQGIHGFNGVDLANSCNSPIFASASGIVLIAKNSGWNGGYGKYVVVAHPNGTQTLYAHNGEVYVKTGEEVGRGQIIATVGNTGNTTAKYRGKTGCHVHFEIRGARNPF